ncbi:MAG: hypothetical protein ACI4Q9_04250 [Candidatus Methanomethylophilaceae archaeon]
MMSRRSGKKERIVASKYLNESSSVIAMMSAVITSGGSLDAAVRKVAADGPKNTAKLFGRIVADADSRSSPDIRAAVLDLISAFPEELSSFRRAMFMTVSASDAKTGEEKIRIMGEATVASLDGIKRAGEGYISKLQFPCTAVFGIGIMVPMILLLLAPMLNIGGMFSMPAAINERTIRMTILFVVPLCVLSVILSIMGRNPFMESSSDRKGSAYVLAAVTSVPVAYLADRMGLGLRETVTLSVVVGSVSVLIAMSGRISAERAREKKAKALRGVLFDLGNRMVTGENFDSALVYALSERKECSKIAEALEREYVLCRGDVEAAVRRCISPYSSEISDALCRISVSSYRDIRDAGRMATALAHQFQNEDQIRDSMRNKLRGMTDMMNGTAALFAPLILGLSIMMMSPLAQVAGPLDTTSTYITVSVYIGELAILISLFTSLLSDRFRAVDIIRKVCAVLPVAMAVLYICSSFVI